MAIVTIQTIENLLTSEQKTQIVAQITDAIVGVKGEAFRRLTWVRIEEIREGIWGWAECGSTRAISSGSERRCGSEGAGLAVRLRIQGTSDRVPSPS